MSVQVFVDEARRADYMLCAAIVPADDVGNARRVMRSLKPGNSRRLHMHGEGAASRRRILAEFVRLQPIREAHVWTTPILGQPERRVRDRCFQALVPDVLELGASRIVVESCGQDRQDARVLTGALASRGAIDTVRIDIVGAAADELLWAADVIGWAYGAGGPSRTAIAELVSVHEVH